MRYSRATCCVALALLGSLLGPAGASAHGANAAAALLGGDASYPVGVRPDLRTALDTMLRQARAKGVGLKVAIVGDRYDVPLPQLLLNPNAYAASIAENLFKTTNERVITVHPVGLGGANLEQPAADAVSAISSDGSGDLDTLVITAMHAVAAVTKGLDKPVPLPRVKPPRSAAKDSGPPAWVSAGGVVVILFAGLGLAAVLGRRREVVVDD